MPAGSVGPSARGLILVPPMGRRDLVDGRPLLSASQIESYLECPYKWFSLRRLGLGDVDAGFGQIPRGGHTRHACAQYDDVHVSSSLFIIWHVFAFHLANTLYLLKIRLAAARQINPSESGQSNQN